MTIPNLHVPGPATQPLMPWLPHAMPSHMRTPADAVSKHAKKPPATNWQP
jgi:hypothetical protein